METINQNTDSEQNKLLSLELKSKGFVMLVSLLPALFLIFITSFGTPAAERTIIEKVFSYAVLLGPVTLVLASILLFIISADSNISGRKGDIKIALALPAIHLLFVMVLWGFLSSF